MVSHGMKFSVSIVSTAILARLLTPQDYGLIGMVAVATNFVSMFKDLGLSFATIQRSEISNEQISTLFWVNVVLSLAILVLMILLAPGVAWFYGDARLTQITIVTSVGFLFGGLAVQHEALLKRQMRFFSLSALAFISMTFAYLVGIALAWKGAGYWALVFSQLALLAANALGVWLLCKWRPGLPRRNVGVKSMLTFGGNITGYALINYFSKNSDNVLLGRFWGPQAVGLYNKAGQLLSLPTDQINEPLAAVSIPALSRLADSPERYRSAYVRIIQKVMLLTIPGITLMMATADWLVLLVLGPQWDQTTRIFICMGVAGLFQPLANTAGWILVSQGRARDMLKWSIINAPISYALAKVIVLNPLLFWFAGRQGPIRFTDFYKLIAPFMLASVFSLLSCLAFRRLVFVSSPIFGFTASAIITFATTMIVLLVLPSGRAILLDIRKSFGLLRPAKDGIVA